MDCPLISGLLEYLFTPCYLETLLLLVRMFHRWKADNLQMKMKTSPT